MVSLSASCLESCKRASFATMARLLSCLVTESLSKAFFVSLNFNNLKGIAIVLNSDTSRLTCPIRSEDVLAIIPLRYIPVLKQHNPTEIGLLDPLDMLPYVYELTNSGSGSHPMPNGLPKIKILDSAPDVAYRANGLGGEEVSSSSFSYCSRERRMGFHRHRFQEFFDLEDTIRNALNAFSISDFDIVSCPGPLNLWTKFAKQNGIGESLKMDVAEELLNSTEWQQYACGNPPLMPAFESPSIVWEQCIIEGHPTHPMHKMRRTLPPIKPLLPGEFNWQEPNIRMILVPRDKLNIQGSWGNYISPVLEQICRAGRTPLNKSLQEVLIPIHELQIRNIVEKFPEARVLPEEYSLRAYAQQSLRSVIIPTVLRSTHLKLAFGIRLTSAVRTISPASAFLGPRFSSKVVPYLTYDRSLLIVQKELASVSSVHPDGEVAKHLGCIIRECYENICEVGHNERAIVCTALVETGFGGSDEVPLVQIVFGLDDEDKRIAWLDRFVELFFAAFLPSVIANGVAFEAHPQNTLARFDMQTKELKGFVVRDFGGLRVHERSVIESTPLQSLDGVIAPGHSIIADTLEDVYTRLYHTLIHNHLQQLIRVLKLHYNGIGWRIVKRHLEKQIPAEHELRKLWLDPKTETLPGKCFMRMRFQGMYRTHLHAPFPNLIHYRGSEEM